ERLRFETAASHWPDRALPPGFRARFVRGRDGREARRGAEPRDGRAGDPGAREPRAPGRDGGRPADRRRRRNPAAAAGRALPRPLRRGAAGARAVRRRRPLPAARGRRPRGRARAPARGDGRARGAAGRRLARARARPDARRRDRARRRAARQAGRRRRLPRPGAGSGRLRAEAVRDPPRRRARRGPRPRDPELQLADARLQGNADGAAASADVRRPARPAHEDGACARPLAHPYRMIAHNGEINTLRGNVNWMRARESQLASELFGDDIGKILPVVRPGGSDTANFDNVLELLVLAGRSLPHAILMMIPDSYASRDDVPDDVRGFYDFHSCLMEPWDGPAAIAFTDGTVAGATLDRNGLRPGRWVETKDGWVVLASEIGVLDTPPENIKRKGRLQPGKIFLVDLEQHRIVEDDEVKRTVAARRPYREWYEQGVVHLSDLPERPPAVPRVEPLRAKQLAFGYTQEDLRVILAPYAVNAEQPIGSMGNDLALAVLSDQRPLLYAYFKQLFAQVTNPPIDSTREYVVMSVGTSVGSERNLLDESPEHAHQLQIPQPILQNHELEALRQVDSSVFKAHTIDITWPVEDG